MRGHKKRLTNQRTLNKIANKMVESNRTFAITTTAILDVLKESINTPQNINTTSNNSKKHCCQKQCGEKKNFLLILIISTLSNLELLLEVMNTLPPPPHPLRPANCSLPRTCFLSNSLKTLTFNPFPHNDTFGQVWARSLLKTLWEKAKLLVQAISPFPAMFSTHLKENFCV